MVNKGWIAKWPEESFVGGGNGMYLGVLILSRVYITVKMQ